MTVHEFGINGSHQLFVTPASDLSRIVLALSRAHTASLTGGGIDIDALIRLVIRSRPIRTDVHTSLAADAQGVFYYGSDRGGMHLTPGQIRIGLLGRRFGLRWHLIGGSPAPEIDPSWRNLSEDGLKQLKASIVLRARQTGEPILQAWQRVEKALFRR